MFADGFSSSVRLVAPRFFCVEGWLSSIRLFVGLFRANSQPVRRSRRSARSLVSHLAKSDALAVVWFLVSFATFPPPAPGDPLTPLSSPPDWDQLGKFQETLTHDQFVHFLDEVYAVGGTAHNCVKVEADYVEIRTTGQHWIKLKFAKETPKPIPKYWQTPGNLPSN